ncbi:MAG: hypothetical protein KAS87_04300, partial [Candidatus Omnitrophica bacterium]|nr:hypothetical protein [Candidatus Omnitrophota bacterium]
VIVTLPVILSLFQGRAGRLEVFSVFSYQRSQEDLQVILDQGGEKMGSLSFNLFHSEGVNFARGIFERWFNHFSGRFLFFEGDWQNPRHSAPNHGMLLLTDLVLLSAGVVGLLRGKGRSSKFILLWLILTPLPAALSRDQVHAVRALNMVIPLTVLSAIGLTGILRWINRIKSSMIRYSYSFLLAAAMLGAVIYYLDSYFIHLPVHNAKHWFYGYKQVIEEITPIQNSYQNIVFQQSYNQPYIYFLFFQQYDPVRYQAQAKLAETGIDVGLVESLDNISFSSFSWPYPTDQKGTLVIADSVGIPHDFKDDDYQFISEIKYPDDSMTAFRIVEVK